VAVGVGVAVAHGSSGVPGSGGLAGAVTPGETVGAGTTGRPVGSGQVGVGVGVGVGVPVAVARGCPVGVSVGAGSLARGAEDPAAPDDGGWPAADAESPPAAAPLAGAPLAGAPAAETVVEAGARPRAPPGVGRAPVVPPPAVPDPPAPLRGPRCGLPVRALLPAVEAVVRTWPVA
jgi:hypothetical protein